MPFIKYPFSLAYETKYLNEINYETKYLNEINSLQKQVKTAGL